MMSSYHFKLFSIFYHIYAYVGMLAHVCISELNELFLILFSNFMSKDSEIHNGKKIY